MIILANNPGLDIVLTIIALLVVLGLTYLIGRSVIKDIIRKKEEKSLLIEGVISRADMISVVNSYINRIERGTHFSLIYLDLDKFEDLNDAFGVKEGNKILENIAKRIKKILPPSAKISRYHGDEFLIFLNNQYNQAEASKFAYQLLEELRNKTKLSNTNEIELTASVALCFYPIHGNSLKRMIESLKIAIYQAKKLGGNTLKVYSDEFKQDDDSVDYFYQVKHAIEKREFQLYYHPIVDYKNKNVYAYEALLRWNHPTLGVLTPNKFINIMEQTGDIHWVGNWGLETIIKSYYELRSISSIYENINFSINLSPKQLLRDNIASEFQRILRKFRGDPLKIILEIGEFALFEKNEQIFNNLIKLSEIGFRIAVDGFSLDLATINRLEELNVDMVKIRYEPLDGNQSNEKRFLKMLLDYTKENNKLVVIESVEDIKTVNFFQKEGINLYQGYLFTPPIPFIEIDEFTKKFLENHQLAE